MGASRTTKKRRSRKKIDILEQAQYQATVETVAEITARLLDKWTRAELTKMAQQGEFVCIDFNRKLYRVGKFDLQNKQQHWVVRSLGGVIIHNFTVKQAAVFYCLYESRNLFNRSSEFLSLDKDYTRLNNQLAEYAVQLKSAVNNKDTFKQDLYLARISRLRPELESLEFNLEKTITSAKYSKVWDINNHETTRTRN